MNTEIKKPIKVWQPRAGDSLKGRLIGTRQAVGTYGENSQLLVEDEYGNVTAVWLNRWLEKNLNAQRASKGDLITLTFLGQKASKTRRYYTPNRFYNEFELVVYKT
jgi:hypothetical protein